MMLAKPYSDRIDPLGWWASEKFDGCRAFWDGTALRTRTWQKIEAPDYFTAELPKGVALDGELWAGRGNFEVAKVLVQWPRASDARWGMMRYMVFDAPTTEAVKIERRWAKAEALAKGAQVEFVAAQRVTSAASFWQDFRRVVAEGGEGLVLKRAESYYDFERSSDWIKVKPCNVD